MVKNHYVYIHRRKSNGTVFYVGQGVRRRAWRTDNRNIHWRRIVGKHGYTVHIVFDGLSQVCAFSMEAALIRFYGRSNLCNLTDGGEVGPLGMKQSEKMIRAQSERMKGNHHTKGWVMPEEERAKRRGHKQTPESIAQRIATRRINHPVKPKEPKIPKPRIGMIGTANPSYGIPKTPEQKAKLRAAMLGTF
jgi:hypothetical protein